MGNKDSAKVATVVCDKCKSDLVRIPKDVGFQYLCACCLLEENKRLSNQSVGIPIIATYFEEDELKGINFKGFGEYVPEFLKSVKLRAASSGSGNGVWDISFWIEE